MKRTVGFYTFGSHKIGLGHIYRCTRLSRYLIANFPDVTVRIFVSDEDDDLLQVLPAEILQQVQILAKGVLPVGPFDTLVVDRLRVSPEIFLKLKVASAWTVSFDDDGPSHFLSDLAVNPLYFPKERRPPQSQTTQLLGLEFAMIASPFFDSRYIAKSTLAPKVLIAQGATDTYRTGQRILNFLVDCQEARGPASLQVLQRVPDIVEFFLSFDFVVTGGGMMSLELSALGVPFILYTEEKREIETAQLISERTGCDFLQSKSQFEASDWKNAFGRLCDFENRKLLSERLRKLVRKDAQVIIASKIYKGAN